MKVYELARELNIKSTDLVKNLTKLGMDYKIASKISDADLVKIRASHKPEELVEENEVSKIPLNVKRGSFIGLMHDGEKFASYHVKISQEEMEKLIHTKLAQHEGVNGGSIKIYNEFSKYINPFMVDGK